MELVLEPWHWFVLGILLILSELLLPAFAALWFGIGAIMVGILYWMFPMMGLTTQILSWIILSVLCTLLWFKFIKPLSIDKTKAGLSREATIGQIGMVIQTDLEQDQIRVRFPLPVLGSDEWDCRALDKVQVGDRVRVVDILGNDLVVQPHSTQYQNEKVNKLCLLALSLLLRSWPLLRLPFLKVYGLFHKAINGLCNVWVNTTPHSILA